MLDLSGGGGVKSPYGSSQPSKFVLTPFPEKIVNINQKYDADPLWFSNKSSTGLEYLVQFLKEQLPRLAQTWTIDREQDECLAGRADP